MPLSNTDSARGSTRPEPATSQSQDVSVDESMVRIDGPPQPDSDVVSDQQSSGGEPRPAGNADDGGASCQISQGLKQLDIGLPPDVLAKVLHDPKGKLPMEAFLGDMHGRAVCGSNGSNGIDASNGSGGEAAWSGAATVGSERSTAERQ